MHQNETFAGRNIPPHPSTPSASRRWCFQHLDLAPFTKS